MSYCGGIGRFPTFGKRLAGVALFDGFTGTGVSQGKGGLTATGLAEMLGQSAGEILGSDGVILLYFLQGWS